MPTLTFQPGGESIEVDSTVTIREAAHQLGLNVHDRCGGNGACCNCVVTILEGHPNINPKTVVEDAVFYLDKEDRLSCQCKLFGDVTVTIPNE